MDSRKRSRDDSAESQAGDDFSVQAVNSSDLDDVKPERDESYVNLPEAKRMHVDLFSILDDSDEPAFQGLDSVIRSFEEEILVSLSGSPTVESTEVSPVGDGSQPDLGYLFEASDDELGLPPTFTGEEEKITGEDVNAESSGSGDGGVGDILGFPDQISSYDSFDLGLSDGPGSHCYNDSGDFVTLGGLFNYSDDNYIPAEISGFQWQSESLSAL